MTIATCRVKVIPDHIFVKADEKDLHPWSPSKIFSDGSRDKINRRGIIAKINLSDMSYDIDVKYYDKLDATDIKDALIRHQPVFKDNYLLDVILYHDYLKNVVVGHMRRSMNEIINQICRENLRKMGDVDGNF